MKIGNFTKKELELINKIKKVVDKVVITQINLLKMGRVERSFSTYFANEIRLQLNTEYVDIDPFCNRHLGATKKLDGKPIELDIAIHERNMDENNLVAIELETNNKPKRDDVWKIEDLTQRSGSDGYHYKLGLYIVFGIKKKAGEIIAMEWYKNGKRLLL